MNDKRGYFVKPHPEADTGYAVIATSAKEARKILWKYGDEFGEGDWEWSNLRAEWKREAKINHLPIGLIDDLKTGLEVGIYCCLGDFICDRCGNEREFVEMIDGIVTCEECKDNLRKEALMEIQGELT